MNYWDISSKSHKTFFKRVRYTLKMFYYKKNVDLLLKEFRDDNYNFIIEKYPKIIQKPFRKYLYCSAKTDIKFNLIASHYNFLSKNIPLQIVKNIYLTSHKLLDFHMENIGNLELILCYISSLGKEGEMMLLIKFNDKDLYSLVFSFFDKNGLRGISIGGIQSRDSIGLDTIRLLTKKMHGLRPRNFLMFVLREIATIFSIELIQAIESKEHIANCSHVKKTGKFQANYDQYWSEELGIKKDEWYIIPTADTRKDMEDIPSKKRSMYKKRYKMLDEFSGTIIENLTFSKKER